MKRKWQNIKLIKWLIVWSFLVLISCAEKDIRQDIQPIYRFNPNQSLFYHGELDIELIADAAVMQYSDRIKLVIDLEVRYLGEDTNYGSRLEILLKSWNLEGGNNPIRIAVANYLNKLSTWFHYIYLTPSGKVNVLYNERPYVMLNTILKGVLPDFTDLDQLWTAYTFSTNFDSLLANNAIISFFKMRSEIVDYNTNILNLVHQIEISSYDRTLYEKSVEPIKMGIASLIIRDSFDYANGQLVSKEGDLDIHYNVPVSKGLISYIISVAAKGVFTLTIMKAPT